MVFMWLWMAYFFCRPDQSQIRWTIPEVFKILWEDSARSNGPKSCKTMLKLSVRIVFMWLYAQSFLCDFGRSILHAGWIHPRKEEPFQKFLRFHGTTGRGQFRPGVAKPCKSYWSEPFLCDFGLLDVKAYTLSRPDQSQNGGTIPKILRFRQTTWQGWIGPGVPKQYKSYRSEPFLRDCRHNCIYMTSDGVYFT